MENKEEEGFGSLFLSYFITRPRFARDRNEFSTIRGEEEERWWFR